MNYEQKGILKSLRDFGLALFSNWVFQQIIYFLFPFVISCVLKSSDKNQNLGLATFYSFPQVIYFAAYILILVGFSSANRHILKHRKFTELNRAVIEELQNNITSLTRYMVTLENDEKEEVFASLSQFVCNSLYTIFSNKYQDRNFRISVVKQFTKQDDLMYTMPGFKSNDLSKGDNRPQLVATCEKYFRTILLTSVERLYILDEKNIKKKFNPSHEKLNEYIAIPHKGNFDKICFILQIDCTKAGSLGNNKSEIEDFIQEYIEPFIKLLENAYVQERMNFIYRGADKIES
jgi:hypothetical protein